jgi:cell division septum initiation protein DivIVA
MLLRFAIDGDVAEERDASRFIVFGRGGVSGSCCRASCRTHSSSFIVRRIQSIRSMQQPLEAFKKLATHSATRFPFWRPTRQDVQHTNQSIVERIHRLDQLVLSLLEETAEVIRRRAFPLVTYRAPGYASASYRPLVAAPKEQQSLE